MTDHAVDEAAVLTAFAEAAGVVPDSQWLQPGGGMPPAETAGMARAGRAGRP